MYIACFLVFYFFMQRWTIQWRVLFLKSPKLCHCQWWLIPPTDTQQGQREGEKFKPTASSVGDIGLVPRSGRSPAEGNSNPFQYSWVENLMDRGAWRATVQGMAKSRIQLSTYIILPSPHPFSSLPLFHSPG